MTLAAILATFVSNYTRQQLTALPSCVGGTLVFATADYPQLTGDDTVTAVLEAENVDLTGFTIEALVGNDVQSRDGGSNTIRAGSSGSVSNNTFSGLAVGNKVRIIAKNCPTVKTDWASLK